MKKFHADRLRFLADHLMTMKPTKENRFDMNNFVKIDECGTAVCAFGTAATLPRFRKAGLSLIMCADLKDKKYFDVVDKKSGLKNFDAAMEFFDLTEKESLGLFNPYEYKGCNKITPKVVARKIYKLLEEKGF